MISRRRSLSSTQREALYDRCRGDKEYPDCNICTLPIRPGERWHESHNPLLPRALRGEVTGIAHARCNLRHAREVDVPLIAKVKRIRRRHIGAQVSDHPMPGGRDDWANRKKKMDGSVVDRTTGEPWRPRT